MASCSTSSVPDVRWSSGSTSCFLSRRRAVPTTTPSWERPWPAPAMSSSGLPGQTRWSTSATAPLKRQRVPCRCPSSVAARPRWRRSTCTRTSMPTCAARRPMSSSARPGRWRSTGCCIGWRQLTGSPCRRDRRSTRSSSTFAGGRGRSRGCRITASWGVRYGRRPSATPSCSSARPAWSSTTCSPHRSRPPARTRPPRPAAP